MSDWFTQNAPTASGGGNWFEQNAPKAAPADRSIAFPDSVGSGPTEHEPDTWWGGFSSSIKKQVMDAMLNNPMLESAAHPKSAADFATLALAAPAPGAIGAAANGAMKIPGVGRAAEAIENVANIDVGDAANAVKERIPGFRPTPVSYAPPPGRVGQAVETVLQHLSDTQGETMAANVKRGVGKVGQMMTAPRQTFQDLPLAQQMEQMGNVAADPVRARVGGPLVSGTETPPAFNELPLAQQMEQLPTIGPVPQGRASGPPSLVQPNANDAPLFQQQAQLDRVGEVSPGPLPAGRPATPPYQAPGTPFHEQPLFKQQAELPTEGAAPLGRTTSPPSIPQTPFHERPLYQQMNALPETPAPIGKATAPPLQNIGSEVDPGVPEVAFGELPLWKQMEQMFASEPVTPSGVSFINNLPTTPPALPPPVEAPLAEAVSGLRTQSGISDPRRMLPGLGETSETWKPGSKTRLLEPDKRVIDLVNELMERRMGAGAKVTNLKAIPYPNGDDPLAKAIRQRAYIAENTAKKNSGR